MNKLKSPKYLSLFIALIGVVILCYSLTLDFYTDQKAKEKLDSSAELSTDENVWKEKYYKEVAKLETSKRKLMDIGSGLTIFGLTLLIFFMLKKSESISDLKFILTYSKVKTFILANLVWSLMLPGTYFYYYFRGMRNDYPWFVDSIGIPIMFQTTSILMAFIPLNIVLFISLYKTILPTNLFKELTAKSISEKVWEGFWALLLFINIIALISFIADGDHISIPINLFFTYVILTLRAGKKNYFQTKQQCL